MTRFRPTFWLLFASILTVVGITVVGIDALTASAQELESKTVSQSQRDQEYRELARDVGLLQKQLGIIKRVARLVGPSVVHIEAQKGDPVHLRSGTQTVEEAGSGVVVQLDGGLYVLTNRHVIKHAVPERIRIKLHDGRVINPIKVWGDGGTDIAVMSIRSDDLTAARIGDSDDLEIGDFVVAVGSPFGLSQSITYGIVSAKGRRDLELGEEDVRFQDFIQTDAAINPGNSGGPLVNLRGELVGINTAIASSSGGNEGIGFSIPIKMVSVVARQLVDHGSVTRAFLGVSLDSKFDAKDASELGLPRPQGARVTAVTLGSPAAEAELQVGDVILTFNGIRVDDDNHLVNVVGLTEVGKSVPIAVFRDRRVIRLNVRVGDRSAFDPAK